MAELNLINMADSFQKGKQNALSNQRQRQVISAEKAQAPIRNQLGQLNVESRQQSADTGKRKQALQTSTVLNFTAKALKDIEPQFRAEAFERLKPQLEAVGIPTEQFKIEDLDEQGLDGVINLTERFIRDPNSIKQLTGENRRIADDSEILKGAVNPKTGKLKPLKDLTTVQEAAAIRQKLIPAAGTRTKEERIAGSPELADKVATSQAKIKSAVKQAEVQAKAKGDAITDLVKQEAALPGIEEVVSKLKVLADDATFTLGGKAYNAVAKQFGFSTSGDTSRTSMVSIVDNQVLPLLKPIFGAAFTAIEGDRLRNAFLDPDSTPDSRKASLDAFLEQVKRNIQTLRGEVNPQQEGQQQAPQAAQTQQAQGQPTATATGPNGEKIGLINGQWVRIDG